MGKQFPFLAKIFADGVYAGPIFHEGLVAILPQLDIEIPAYAETKRNDEAKGLRYPSQALGLRLRGDLTLDRLVQPM